MKLKKGDTIIVLAGKDKGKTGTIETAFPKKNKVLVAGINVYKRHMKKRDEKNPGGIIDKPLPIHVSKVALIDKKTKKPTRIGYLVTKGEKSRISKKSGELIG
jgi:large subunit ribosomal protein L24